MKREISKDDYQMLRENENLIFLTVENANDYAEYIIINQDEYNNVYKIRHDKRENKYYFSSFIAV